MDIRSKLITIHVGAAFIFSFLILFPLFFFSAQREKWHLYGLKINRAWAHWFFRMSLLPVQLKYDVPLSRNENYIFCANHFSFLDIPTMGLLNAPFKIIGKSSIGSIPLFGYMFRKLHIMVNRKSFVDRGKSYLKASQALNAGFNIAMFPEGGITSKNIPEMNPFLDGAFQLAVKNNVPIVPVALLTNHHIMPDDDTFRINRSTVKVHVLAPIYPGEQSETEVDRLRERVYGLIQNDLDLENRMIIKDTL